MAAETGTVYDAVPGMEGKMLYVTVGDTADDGDTVAVDLTAAGMTSFQGHLGFIHTTANSVVVQEQPTTAVSSGTLTLTVGGSTDNKQRFYVLFGL